MVQRETVKRWLFLGALLCCLWVMPVLAQSGTVVVDDPDKLFGDGGAVKTAAQRLASEGADVVVVGVRNAGADSGAAQTYVDNRLQALGIASNTHSLRGSQIVFFVAPTPGFDGIYFVAKYKDKLQPVFQRIQTTQMRPLFTQGDYAEGMVTGIDAVRTTLNPPTSPLIWVALGVIVVGVIAAVGLPLLRRQRQVAATAAAAQSEIDQARQAAANEITSLGQRMKAAKEQAPYDRVTYSAAEAQRIAGQQSKSEQTFAQAQSAFDAAEEDRANTGAAPATHKSVVDQYGKALQLVRQAASELTEVEQMRATATKEQAPQTGETERLS